MFLKSMICINSLFNKSIFHWCSWTHIVWLCRVSKKVGGDKDYMNHHHHHVVPLARISQTISRHFSLSFIAPGRSSGLHSVSSHSCWMYVQTGRSAFSRPYVGVHRSTSLMSRSLLLQQCGRIVGALWGVAARTCLILLATFLCNCRLASSPAV